MKPVTIYLRPLNQRTGQRIDVRVADGPSADAYGIAGFEWQPALITRPTMSIELMSVDMDGRVQAGQARFDISLRNLFSINDALRLYWKGAAVVIHNTGALEGPSAIPDFWGYVTSARIDLETRRLSVTAEVSTALIDKPLLTGEFTGGGGILGDPAKRGVLWPAGFGTCGNCPPVWFDLTRNIGMIDGYGNTLAINGLFEGRSSLGPRVADYASYAFLAAAIDNKTIKPGQWGSCVAEGLVGLGAPPVGVIGVDAVFGANRPGAWMKRILLTHAKVPAARVQVAAFDALDVAVPRAVHWWTDQQRGVKDLLEAIAQSCNATPLVTFQNMVSVTRAVIGAPVGTLDRSGGLEPRVMDWSFFENEAPYYLLKGRAARPALVLTDDQVNYVDTLEDKGVYAAATVYRAGNLVWLNDGSQWLYQNATPSSGHAPPSAAPPDADGNVSDAWWFRRQPPKSASDFTYQDGTPIEALKPAQPGATSGAPAGTSVGGVLAEDLIGNVARIAADDWLSTAEKPQAILAFKALEADWNSLDARYRALGSPADITPAWEAASRDFGALGTYLVNLTPGWSDVNYDTRIVPATYRDVWGKAYTSVAALAAAITGRKGDPGANGASAFTLVNVGNCQFPTPNSIRKVSGTQGWDGKARTAQSFIGAAAISARLDQGTFIGLTPDPSADLDYASIDYGWHLSGNGRFYFYQNGTPVWESGDSPLYGSGSLGRIVADGSVVRFYIGDDLRYSAAMIDKTAPLYGVFALAPIGTNITDVAFTGNGIVGADGKSAPLLLTQWSIDGVSNWHFNYFGADKYLRTSNDNGVTWSAAVKAVGEDGTIGADGVATSIVFTRSATVPPRPQDNTGDPPTGWSDGPPAGTEILWMSVARFKAGVQQTGWSFPERITGPRGEQGRPAIPYYQDAQPANPIEGDQWVTLTMPKILRQYRGGQWVEALGPLASLGAVTASLIAVDSLAAISANIGFLVSYNAQGGRFERDGNGERGYYNNGQIGVKIGF